MAPGITIDEIHLTVTVPLNLNETEAKHVSRTLRGRRFMTALGRAVRDVLSRHPTLAKARVVLNR